MQQRLAGTHRTIVMQQPLSAVRKIQRRKSKELECPVGKPIPLLVQPLGIFTGTLIDDIVNEGREQVVVVDRQGNRTLPVTQFEGDTHKCKL